MKIQRELGVPPRPDVPPVYTRRAGWQAVRGDAAWAGRSIGFVPTMGALHAGHEALLARARAENERVVLSIFVNPTQFNDPTDLAKYPRTLEADLALARSYVDAVLAPEPEELYPDAYRYRVTENELSRRWEGAHRPGHFDGVLTVVLKLFNLVRPTRAYFGEKDWQQLLLVRGMVQALLLPIEVVPCATVREADGLAMSSRNRRLAPADRARAPEFARALRESPDAPTAAARLRAAGFEVDYVEDADGVRMGAVRLGDVRLIDNCRLPAAR
ncbi:pantoate--beta-alanine ligase [Opitutus sp. ER46]|uniref:pantoate--beta-alanine ligase n=1 Tax=Opitutus sp. ER46 TaxID=2161864 RepID=UPI000D2F7808|nr:pantoate--beta-alanine ligase [Opitutus sp. ER46]PTX91766.1 pantoate--beta-alanine ligase [Opitutus sp. ER46]